MMRQEECICQDFDDDTGCLSYVLKSYREQFALMREALQESWLIFDVIGTLTDDAQKLDVVHSAAFSSAALRVRSALIKTM